jgi:HAD superfamily hydrolase (TIGR01509 family)
MGGVMYRYWSELTLDIGGELGWPIHRIPLGPTGAVPDPDYKRLAAGEIGEDGYIPIVITRLSDLGIEFDPHSDLRWQSQERPRTWETIGKIHQAGHRQVILTNDASRWLGTGWWTTWEHAAWFEASIDAAILGQRKPDPDPYIAAAAALDAPTTDCLFVDDLPANCAGAEAVGMQSHCFSITDPEGSMVELEERLGL